MKLNPKEKTTTMAGLGHVYMVRAADDILDRVFRGIDRSMYPDRVTDEHLARIMKMFRNVAHKAYRPKGRKVFLNHVSERLEAMTRHENPFRVLESLPRKVDHDVLFKAQGLADLYPLYREQSEIERRSLNRRKRVDRLPDIRAARQNFLLNVAEMTRMASDMTLFWARMLDAKFTILRAELWGNPGRPYDYYTDRAKQAQWDIKRLEDRQQLDVATGVDRWVEAVRKSADILRDEYDKWGGKPPKKKGNPGTPDQFDEPVPLRIDPRNRLDLSAFLTGLKGRKGWLDVNERVVDLSKVRQWLNAVKMGHRKGTYTIGVRFTEKQVDRHDGDKQVPGVEFLARFDDTSLRVSAFFGHAADLGLRPHPTEIHPVEVVRVQYDAQYA